MPNTPTPPMSKIYQFFGPLLFAIPGSGTPSSKTKIPASKQPGISPEDPVKAKALREKEMRKEVLKATGFREVHAREFAPRDSGLVKAAMGKEAGAGARARGEREVALTITDPNERTYEIFWAEQRRLYGME